MGNGKLRLSIAGGTGWAAETVLHCPHHHFLKYEQGWRRKLIPDYFAFGILFHHAYFTNDMDSFRSAWHAGRLVDHEGELAREFERDEETVESGIDIAEKMMAELQDQHLHILTVERKLESPIIDPNTGETPEHLEGVVVSGRQDLLEHRNGHIEMGDIKTPGRMWGKREEIAKRQLPTYRYLEACMGDDVHDIGSYHLITKTKTPRYDRRTIRMGASDDFAVYTTFRAAAETILRCREEWVWPKTGPCQGMYGQICDYLPLCFPERYDDPETEVNNTLTCVK